VTDEIFTRQHTFEKLKHIRKRISNASKFQQWAFHRIQEYTEYKAAEYGISVEKIAPQYTSQRCSHVDCSFTHKDNRDGDEFCCLNLAVARSLLAQGGTEV